MRQSHAFALLTSAFGVTLAAAGCGNQMLRQPSHGPLSSPRAMPPPGSTAFAIDAYDTAPITNAQFGSTGARLPEPALPPANLSDRARYQPSPTSVDKLTNPLAGQAEAVETGRTIYLNRCTQCHDPEGRGRGPVGRYLIPPPVDLTSPLAQRRTDGALFWHISMGQGKMPGFRNWTTTYQRWALVDYVRTFRTRPGSTETVYPRFGGVGFERRSWRPGGPNDGE